MGCGCGSGGAKAALKGVQKYQITDDPEATPKQYLTEREALTAQVARGLDGPVVPVQ